jgi:GNAT superfamily N-acetyltransferase
VNAPSVVEKLRRDHALEAFNCGAEDLNQYLRRHALLNQQAQGAQTYVLVRELLVLGYYSLAAGSVRHDEASDRARKGLARHPIPVILLARLAVDQSVHGAGIGAALLKDALLRAASAADAIGARAVLVHARDDRARRFYEHFGFEASPSDPLHLMLLMKDIQRSLMPAR